MAYTTASVNAWYQAVQFQNGATATVNSWVSGLNSGVISPAEVQNSIITQDAYTLGVVNPVLRLYQSSFNSVPDQAGQAYWVGQFGSGAQTYQQIANGFATSVQFKGIYGNTTATQIANTAQVTLMYLNILQRNPDAAGLAYWSTKPIGEVLAGISASPEMVSVSLLPVQNFQAAEIAGTAAGSGSLYNYPGFPTTTVVLTTGIDTVTGTNLTVQGTGTIEGTNGTFTSATTFNTGDSITPTGLVNTISLTVDGQFKDATATALTTPLVSGVQTLSVRNIVAQNGGAATDEKLTINATNFSGLTTFNSNLSTAETAVTNLASGGTFRITGNGVVSNGILGAGYVAGATAATLNIVGGTKGSGAVTLSGSGLTSTTVNSSGGSNTIGALTLAATTTALTINASTNLTTGAVTNTGAAALTTVTVTGAGAVDLSTNALETTVTSVNASANSGGLTVKLSDKVTMVAVGGSGNDVFTSNAILTTGSVNAGTGSDTLVAGDINQINTAALGAKYTGFETLRFNGAMDATFVSGITKFQISGTTGNALTNIGSTQSVVVYAANATSIGDTSLAAASGTSNTLGMTFGYGGTGTNTATRVGTLTLTGFSTLNAATGQGSTAAAGADRTAIIDAFTAPTLTAVNLTGTSFTLSNIATTLAVTINGSALTGNGDTTANAITGLTVAGNAVAGSLITGSAVSDKFTLGTASASTYNSGAGNDFIFATNAQIGDAATDPTVIGGDGTDTLNLTSTLTLVDTDFAKLTGFEAIKLDGTGAVSATLSTNANAAFTSAVTVTSGTTANNATYTWSSGSYTGNVTLTDVNSGDGATTADNVSITTGAGNDTVTLTAASFVGSGATGTANGTITIATGSGADTITVTTGTLLDTNTVQAVTITAGTAADTIAVTHVNGNDTNNLISNFKFTMANGDSILTAYDNITGFKYASATTVSDNLDFTTVALNAYSATAVTGYTAAQLTVAVSSVGAVTFAGSAASTLTLAQKIASVADVVNVNVGDTAFFTDTNSVGVTSTYVFNNVAGANDNLVQLIGITDAAGIITTNNADASVAKYIFVG